MKQAGLQGIPVKKRWQSRKAGETAHRGEQSPRPGLFRGYAQHQMGDGYHVYPHGGRVALPGGCAWIYAPAKSLGGPCNLRWGGR